jgi:hypothetical protein
MGLSLGIGLGLTKGQRSGINPGWNLVGISESSPANGASLTKTAADDGTFSNCSVTSTVSLHGNGSASWSPSVGASVVGLCTSGAAPSGYMAINFSLYNEANDGVLDAIELGGVVFAPGAGTYAYGDTFKIQVTGTVVTYYLRGVLWYTSLVAATLPLFLVGVCNQHGSTINNLTLAGAWR